MSYDIYLMRGDQTFEFDEPHNMAGGTMCVGGTTEAWLNVTYNYGKHFYRTMGEKGIRTIYGMTAADSLPVLDAAIAQLGDDVHPDCWEPTEGNAKRALMNLRAMAGAAPADCVWSGD